MTPQETQLVSDLFDRLAKLENTPRDAAADRLIADGLQRAPHAVYALVQTALVQDEALRRANARIEELQEQTGDAPEAEQRPASFLDTMREALTGRAPARGSVPSVRPQGQSMSQNFQSQDTQPQSGSPPTPPPGYPGSAPPGAGGSFLGNAGSTAAGVLGGALLLDGIRSMFGHHPGGGAPSSFGGFGDNASPWNSNAGAANGDLARELGTDQIGQRDYDTRNDRPADVESVADTDDTDDSYDADDDDNADGDDDFDDDDTGDDSYDA